MVSALRPKFEARRTERALQLGALLLFLLGLLSLLLAKWTGIVSLLAGAAGISGIFLKLYRMLVLFIVLAWLTVVVDAVEILNLIAHPNDGAGWLVWLLTGLVSVPAAVLSSTLHVLRVWRPEAMVTEQTAPLFDAATSAAPCPRRPGDGGTTSSHSMHIPVARSVWPPKATGSNAGSTLYGKHIERLGRGTSAKKVWPPPGNVG